MDSLINTIQKFIKPFKCGKKRPSLPWVDNDIHQLKEGSRIKTITSSKLDKSTLIFKGLRNKVVSELRKAKIAYFMLLIAQSGGSSSSLWRHINRLSKQESNQRKGIIQLNVNGVISCDGMVSANALNAYFVQSVEELAANFRLIETSVNDNKFLFHHTD